MSGTEPTPLHALLRRHDAGALIDALAKGADPNQLDRRGSTALHLAAERNLPRHVEALLDNKAILEKTDSSGLTPLMRAVIGRPGQPDNLETVKLLIERGAKLWQRSPENDSVLNLACREGRVDMLRLLVESGLNPLMCGNGGDPPLITALRYEKNQCATYLLEVGAPPHQPGKAGGIALHVAVNMKDPALLVDLLNRIPHLVDANNNALQTPLHIAARHGKLDALNRLLTAGAKVDSTDSLGSTPLMEAVKKGHAEIVSVLLNAGANPNILAYPDPHDSTRKRVTPLHVALNLAVISVKQDTEQNQIDIIARLIAGGADVDKRGDIGLAPIEACRQRWPFQSDKISRLENIVQSLLEQRTLTESYLRSGDLDESNATLML